MQALLVRVLRSSESKDLKICVLRSANMLVHNLSQSKSDFYTGKLVRMAFISELIEHPFNFADDELSENYVSFLKTLCLSLPENLLLSFLNHTQFSLFAAARSFCFYQESMVRIASQTITLTVLRLQHPIVTDYIISSGFLLTLAIKLKEMAFEVHKKHGRFIDVLYYIDDIYNERIPEVTNELTLALEKHFVKGLVDRMSAVASLAVLTQVVGIVKCPQLTQIVVGVLFDRIIVGEKEDLLVQIGLFVQAVIRNGGFQIMVQAGLLNTNNPQDSDNKLSFHKKI